MFRQLAFSILSLYLSAPCLILADENSNSGPVPNYGVDSNGASGGSGDTYSLSKGGLIAIIVVVVLVAIFGIASAVLFYIAKKRQWEVRKTIKRASKRVVTDVRRSMDGRRSRPQSRHRGAVRMQSPPSMPKDLEKGERGRVTHRMEVEEPRASTKQEKRMKAILPDSWSVGGRR